MRVSLSSRALAALTFVSSTSALSNSSSTSTSAILSDGYVQLGDFNDAYEKAKAFVATLDNAAKVSIITGQSVTSNSTSGSSWTALANKDGVSGINYAFYVSGFTMANALTMSWNRELIEQQFRAIGDEFYGMGYNLINGPEPGPLGRVPYGGRTPESFAADPYLTGIAMGKAISGMNSAGVIAGGRHFLLNEQETNRSSGISATTSAVYTSNADDKTIHELYSWPFADGVKSGMMAVMCGMTRVNGTLCCENNDLISKVLKKEMGFLGLVFPDVNSQSTSYGSANAGLDYGSSNYWTEDILNAGINNGSFTQDRLDDMAIRNVIGYYSVGLDNGKQPETVSSSTEYRDVRGNHSKLIRQVAGESIVLLKNSNTSGLGLPLKKPRTISLFGAHAGPALAGPNQPFSVQGTDSDVYQGHLASGTGSGQLSLPYLVTPFQAITARAIEDNSMIWWLLNNTYTSTSSGGMGGGGGSPPGGMTGNATTGGGMGGGNSTGGGMGGGGGGGLGNLGQGTATTPSFSNYAENSEVCLVFMNSYSGEGGDRSLLYDDEQDAMVTSVASNCNNTVVIVNTAGPRVLDAWIENENVTAVLYSGLLGQESGNAITDVLYGDVNPSAKVTHTIAKKATDYPAQICLTEVCEFSEGVYIDYRYFDSKNTTVRFPFGHGLSYTTFSYDKVDATATNQTALSSKYPTGALFPGGQADLWDEVVSVKTKVQNTGAIEGSEVAQLYVTFPAEAAQPTRVLRGFEKVNVAPGQSGDVTFSLRRRDLSYWDTTAQQWAVAKGTYTFSVGASSRDIRGTAQITV
ncbi:putative beta-glucosidase D [Colletotrichum sp. SAR 10_70]|nr:putative beta-glucosidase D [Colletotrichum sp. SAR 10_71]KAI8174306.1 putative beta-glucosidase D [Colletotrichum sp. SAR 10_75]KAI8199561.1 putative beta-glucosidase D [Colletotrichum sp. SAR 10_76]KAI8204815.1 putative beta-glucosidase D [Colletotrichum sp. SAR 10_70]KAI8235705.1 putative beta-glucosidase D [Colletotrichum sp. SAR 10_86]KAI8264376.1 putative beta-glucosidase D [Colletotrichum sp. SAR 10_77]KAJ4996085.1 putative beta-glucosidase D [Colletotrichum sp. SAR 10_66]